MTTAKVVAVEHPERSAEHELDIWIGGPVEPERSWILLHDSAPDGHAVRVCDGVFLSTSAGVLQQIIDHSADPRTKLIAGYAGWGPGQLDAEIAASAWLTVSIEAELLFDTPAEQMWESAIRKLGADPGTLQTGRASTEIRNAEFGIRNRRSAECGISAAVVLRFADQANRHSSICNRHCSSSTVCPTPLH